MGKIHVYSSAGPNYLRYKFDDQAVDNHIGHRKGH